MPPRAMPEMDGPATYRICVCGRLSPDWSCRLAGMRITPDRGGPAARTILRGRLADQAALSGLLNSLYALHLPVISVECLEAGGVRAPEAAPRANAQ